MEQVFRANWKTQIKIPQRSPRAFLLPATVRVSFSSVQIARFRSDSILTLGIYHPLFESERIVCAVIVCGESRNGHVFVRLVERLNECFL